MINGVKVRPGPKLVFVEFGMFPIYPRAVFLFDKWIYISSMIWSYFRILKDLFIDLILFRLMWRSIFRKQFPLKDFWRSLHRNLLVFRRFHEGFSMFLEDSGRCIGSL